MKDINKVLIKCPCCNEKIFVQINGDTGEISCVPFYINNKNQYEVDMLLKKYGIEFGEQKGGE